MSEPAVSSVLDPTNPYGLPTAFSSLTEEYTAARQGALFVSRNARGRSRLLGDKAREMLTGLVTNDVTSLTVGQGMYAAALTPKGKIISDLRIYARDEGLWIDAPPLAWPGWWSTIRKFINPRLARYEDLTAQYLALGVYGTGAARALSETIGVSEAALAELPAYGHVALGPGAVGGLVARVPDAGIAGFEVWVPSDQEASLNQRLRAAGVLAGGAMVADVLRVEAGRPEWGIDMDDSTLAQEANLDDLHAISYTKGCYTGQETVARVHFRGHVNRHLRGLRVQDAAIVGRGSELLNAEGQVVGEVRSAVSSPRLGSIALAMVRRELSAGERVTIAGRENTVAEVVTLPFA